MTSLPEPLIALSVEISTPTDPVDINDRENFVVVKRTIPGVAHRRSTVSGDFEPGEALISAVPDTAILNYVVRVLGTDMATHATLAQQLFSALAQFEYTITETIDEAETVWERCQPADIIPREQRDDGYASTAPAARLQSGVSEYAITVRCDPQALEGLT